MKYPEIREFSSREEMDAYEDAREEYMMSRMKFKCGLLNFYKYLFLDTFIPKYRRIMKEYEAYLAGYWRDSNGYIWSTWPVSSFPDSMFKDGDIFVHTSHYEYASVLAIYVYRITSPNGTGEHIMISPDQI